MGICLLGLLFLYSLYARFSIVTAHAPARYAFAMIAIAWTPNLLMKYGDAEVRSDHGLFAICQYGMGYEERRKYNSWEMPRKRKSGSDI